MKPYFLSVKSLSLNLYFEPKDKNENEQDSFHNMQIIDNINEIIKNLAFDSNYSKIEHFKLQFHSLREKLNFDLIGNISNAISGFKNLKSLTLPEGQVNNDAISVYQQDKKIDDEITV